MATIEQLGCSIQMQRTSSRRTHARWDNTFVPSVRKSVPHSASRIDSTNAATSRVSPAPDRPNIPPPQRAIHQKIVTEEPKRGVLASVVRSQTRCTNGGADMICAMSCAPLPSSKNQPRRFRGIDFGFQKIDLFYFLEVHNLYSKALRQKLLRQLPRQLLAKSPRELT